MATFKPTSTSTKKKTFTPTKYAGYNTSTLRGYEYENKSALDILNEYQNKINRGEWISTEDRAKYKAAVDSYTSSGNALRSASKFYGTKYSDEEEKGWQDYLASLSGNYNSINDFYNQFEDDVHYGEWKKYWSPIDDPDYNKYVEAGKTVKNPEWYEAVLRPDGLIGNMMGGLIGDYGEIKNPVTFAENNNDLLFDISKGSKFTIFGQLIEDDYLLSLINDYMTEDEKNRFNYYLGKNDTKMAQEYLDYMTEQLKARQGDQLTSWANNVPIIERLMVAGAGLEGGVQGYENFVRGVLGQEGVSPSALMYGAAALRKDDNEISKILNDTASSIGNMAPSMAIGALTGGAGGAIAMGISSAGNAYSEMLQQGYSVDQARLYGILTGASEAALSYAIGGITELGGGHGGIFQTLTGKVLPAVNNGLARFAIDVGGNVLDEFVEEAAQTLLDSVFKYAATSGKEKFNIDWGEVVYSGMLGALSAGMIEGIPTAINTGLDNYISHINHGGLSVGETIQAAFAKEVKLTDAFNEGLKNVTNAAGVYANAVAEVDPNNKAAKYVQDQIKSGKNVSGYQINRLATELDTAITNHDRGAIKSAVEARLNELGEEGDVSKLADVLTKQAMGEKLSLSEKKALTKSTYGEWVSSELDPESVNRGFDGEYSDFAESIGTKRVNSEAYNRQTKAETANATPENARATEAKIAAPARDVKSVIEQAAKDKIGKIDGFTEETANVMVKDYDGSVSPSEYVTTFEEAFKLGRDNAQIKELTRLSKDSGVIGRALLHAYDAGLQSRNVALEATNPENTVLQNGTESAIINTESEIINNEGKTATESISLRRGGERINGAYSEGQISSVEGSAGQTASRGEARRIADSKGVNLYNTGREVRVADLGILNGSKQQKVRVIDNEADYTPSMKQAAADAKKHGLTAKFYVGDNILIEEANGSISGVRGYILGNTILVRADHEVYTSDQIARHEAGHNMIAKGQVNVKAVKKKLVEVVGKENVKVATEHYAEAYDGSGLTTEEIWEEIICDSLGDMNIFAGDKVISEFMSPMINEIKAVTESETKAPTQTRGSPEGKASRDLRNQKGSKYLTYKFSGVIHVDYTNVYVSDEDLAVIGHSVKTGWGRLNPEKTLGGVFTANDYYVFTYNNDHSITIINAFDLNAESETVDIVKEAINDSRIRANEIEAFSGWVDSVRDGGRFSFADYTNDGGKTREEGKTFKLDDRTSEGDSITDNRTGNKNSRTEGKASRELDTEYLSAVNRGDMETAQRMVDEAAKKAGYTVRGLHATNAEFNAFDISKTSAENFHGKGIYFTNSARDLENNYENYEGPDPWQKIEGRAYELAYDKYGISYEDTLTSDSEVIDKLNECYDIAIEEFKKTGRRITAYLRFDNPLILEKGMQIPNDYSEYDGIIDKQVYENIGHSGMDENTVHYVVLNPNNIKSADPVTYDDNGKVIPLSERFNPENTDIRYSRELDLIDYVNENEVDDDLAKEYSKADKSMIDRLHLINALESITDYPSERGILSDYRAMVETIAELEKRIASIDADIKVLSKNAKVNAEAIKTLKAERKMLEMRVHKADEKVLKLESTKALKGVVESEREKAYRKAKQEGREALLTQRAKSDAKLDAVKDYYRGKLAERRAAANAKLDATVKRYQEARAKGIEGRHKTAERHAIKALKDKFIKMMDHPTDRQYIPANLISAMVDVCQMIDTDTDLYKADGSINKAQQKRNEQMERLLKLRDEYAALGKNPDPMYSGEFDQDILDYLDELRQDYTGKSLNEMTLVELKEFRHILRAIDETLQDARKLIGWGEADSVYDAGDRIISDQRAITEKRKGKGEKTAISMVIDNSISPLRNVKRMADYKADSPLVKSFRDLELGVRKKNKFAMDAYKSFETLTSGENEKKFEDAIYKPYGKEYVDKEGRKFHVSKMQMMQAIMSYNRELANDKLKHVSEGGFTFADLDLLNKGNLKEAIDPKNAHSVSFGAVLAMEFQSALANDSWAQEYMKTAEQFFDGTAKDAINEANMTLKHRIIATGSKYIPYEVNKDFVVREITSENDIQQTISGYGMMKDLKDGATQPLIITGLNNILERHIDQVSNIHGLAVPVRNFNKVWNVKAQDGSTTVQEAIKRNFGDRGAKVMIQAVKDVQGSRIKPEWERVYGTIKGNVIGATFIGNGSVVTKQVGSLFTATAKMKWRDPVSMIGNLLYTMANYKKISAEVDKYTASAWMRRQGMSDAELHSLTTEAKKKGVVRLVSKLPTAINPTKWISGMDSMVALSLWKYAKADVAKQTGLSGEDLNKAAAEYYDDIIENTQSMSDALHRPEIQKSGGVISETLGTFKTDLYQGAGLMADALGEYRANPTKENANALAKAVTGNVMSALWGSIMTTAFALLRYKVNRYRDDEDDEIDAESWLKVQGSDLAGDLVGYIVPLFGGEVYDIVSAVIKGEQIESFDNMVLEAINDFVNACVGVGNAVRQGDWANETAYKKLINSIGSIFGVPISNMTRLWEAINLHAQDIANGELGSFEAGLTSPNNTRLYRAYIEGDADKINKASRLYKDEAALKAGLRKGLRDNDPRLREAAIARLNGDTATYNRLCEEVIAEGKFDRTIIIDAFAAEYNYHNTKKKEAEAEGKTYP